VPELQSPPTTQRSQLPTTRGLRQGLQSAVTLTQTGPTIGVLTQRRRDEEDLARSKRIVKSLARRRVHDTADSQRLHNELAAMMSSGASVENIATQGHGSPLRPAERSCPSHRPVVDSRPSSAVQLDQDHFSGFRFSMGS
jgi:hypothetical protein